MTLEITPPLWRISKMILSATGKRRTNPDRRVVDTAIVYFFYDSLDEIFSKVATFVVCTPPSRPVFWEKVGSEIRPKVFQG